MSITQKQIDTLNKWLGSAPALAQSILTGADKILMGDLLDSAIANFKTVNMLVGEVLADAATTVVVVPGVDPALNDVAVAVISLPNTGGTIATGLAAVVTDVDEVTITPEVTPTNADGLFSIQVQRPVV